MAKLVVNISLESIWILNGNLTIFENVIKSLQNRQSRQSGDDLCQPQD